MQLPPPRDPSAYHLSLVCLGNICRSPIAAVVVRQQLAEAGLTAVRVDSAGLGGWHVGEGMDPRSARVLVASGYDADEVSAHRAQQFDRDWFAGRDLVLGMDDANLDGLRRLAGPGDRHRVGLFGWFGRNVNEIPDPYTASGEAFDKVLEMVEEAAAGLVAELGSLLAPAD
ncbi:low molecular weight protein-tyrosine-phosphatase [Actinopolymorpha sp. NPDC004070]|uniref:low molecular weight protein-tyrosine-phosphatase n=1 Tax=Actinopolymorpha sp. NPDC004070 TaxID=3154548 RepID=UPI0033A734CF